MRGTALGWMNSRSVSTSRRRPEIVHVALILDKEAVPPSLRQSASANGYAGYARAVLLKDNTIASAKLKFSRSQHVRVRVLEDAAPKSNGRERCAQGTSRARRFRWASHRGRLDQNPLL